MSSCSHGMWNDGEDCDICRLDKDQARKLKEAETRIVELERAARAAHQAWVSESDVAEAMHVLAHVLAFGTASDYIDELEQLDPNSMERVWEQTKQVIREAGEDPDDLLARAAKNVEDWRMGPRKTTCDYCLGKGEWQNEFLDWCPCPRGCPIATPEASESKSEKSEPSACADRSMIMSDEEAAVGRGDSGARVYEGIGGTEYRQIPPIMLDEKSSSDNNEDPDSIIDAAIARLPPPRKVKLIRVDKLAKALGIETEEREPIFVEIARFRNLIHKSEIGRLKATRAQEESDAKPLENDHDWEEEWESIDHGTGVTGRKCIRVTCQACGVVVSNPTYHRDADGVDRVLVHAGPPACPLSNETKYVHHQASDDLSGHECTRIAMGDVRNQRGPGMGSQAGTGRDVADLTVGPNPKQVTLSYVEVKEDFAVGPDPDETTTLGWRVIMSGPRRATREEAQRDAEAFALDTQENKSDDLQQQARDWLVRNVGLGFALDKNLVSALTELLREARTDNLPTPAPNQAPFVPTADCVACSKPELGITVNHAGGPCSSEAPNPGRIRCPDCGGDCPWKDGVLQCVKRLNEATTAESLLRELLATGVSFSFASDQFLAVWKRARKFMAEQRTQEATPHEPVVTAYGKTFTETQVRALLDENERLRDDANITCGHERLIKQAKDVVRAWEDDPTSTVTENEIRELGLRADSAVDAAQRTDKAKPEPDWLKRTAEARDKAGWMAWDRATEVLDAAAGDMPQPWRNATIALLAEHHPAWVIEDALSTLRCVSHSIPDSAWNHQAMMQRAIQTLEKLPHVPEPSKNGENVDPNLKSNLRKSIDRIGVLNYALARAVECLSEDPNPFHRDLAVQLSSLVANPWEDDGQPISNLALAGMLSSVLDAWRHEANQGDGIDENHAKLYETAYGYIREYWPSFIGRPDRHAPLPKDKRPVELPPSLRRCFDILVAGGTLVSSNECSAIEIAYAQAENRFYVDANALGYVARPKRAASRVDEELPTEPKKLAE